MELNKSDEAIKAFDKALEVNPKNPIAWDGKRLALENLNKQAKEIKTTKKQLKTYPRHW